MSTQQSYNAENKTVFELHKKFRKTENGDKIVFAFN
jgi:hypothetical protein